MQKTVKNSMRNQQTIEILVIFLDLVALADTFPLIYMK